MADASQLPWQVDPRNENYNFYFLLQGFFPWTVLLLLIQVVAECPRNKSNKSGATHVVLSCTHVPTHSQYAVEGKLISSIGQFIAGTEGSLHRKIAQLPLSHLKGLSCYKKTRSNPCLNQRYGKLPPSVLHVFNDLNFLFHWDNQTKLKGFFSFPCTRIFPNQIPRKAFFNINGFKNKRSSPRPRHYTLWAELKVRFF